MNALPPAPPSSPLVPARNRERWVRIQAREAQRLRERFLTRAAAVFYARITLLIVAAGVLLLTPWQNQSRAILRFSTEMAAFLFFTSLATTWISNQLAGHPRHGRWVLFSTLIYDLILVVVIAANTGLLASPAMAVLLLYTIFFALLFPSPIAILPPLSSLPLLILLYRFVPSKPSFSTELLLLSWHAALNGLAVYTMVYLTGREEKQHREIVELEQELKKLAVAEERNRLAREIHDGIGAALSGLIIQSEYALTLLRGSPHRAQLADLDDEVRELKVGAEEAIDEVRRAVSMMRDDFELVPQLENTCSTFTARHKIPVQLKVTGQPPFLTDEQDLTIFRILQECLTNIAKHAKATNVVVDVLFEHESMTMDIIDDGKGFDVNKTPKNHYGLINMRERAKKAGGEVSISSQIGQGTKIHLRVLAKAQGSREEI